MTTKKSEWMKVLSYLVALALFVVIVVPLVDATCWILGEESAAHTLLCGRWIPFGSMTSVVQLVHVGIGIVVIVRVLDLKGR